MGTTRRHAPTSLQRVPALARTPFVEFEISEERAKGATYDQTAHFISRQQGSPGPLARDVYSVHPTVRKRFRGAASEFRCRKPSGIEIDNDIDSDIYNMFAAIRDPKTCAELQRLLRAGLRTDASSSRNAECYLTTSDSDSVCRAWAFLVTCNTGDIRSFPRK